MAEETTWLIIGTLILLGIIVSFVPQYRKIYATKSSEGISSYFMFVATFSTFASFLNSMIFYRDVFKDCINNSINDKKCYSEILGFVQIGCLWLCLMIQYILFIIYLKKPDVDFLLVSKPRNVAGDKNTVRIFIAHNFLIIILFGITVLLLSIDHNVEVYARLMGLLSMIGGIIQYIPQIYKTFKYKIIGSLSLGAMMMQVPGSYIWVGFLISQSSAHYSTWVPYLVSATLQLILFLICLWIKYVYKAPFDAMQNDRYDYEYGYNYQNNI